MTMGDEDEISTLIDDDMHEQLPGLFFSDENYNRVRYDDAGNEYHLVLVVRRGQPKENK